MNQRINPKTVMLEHSQAKVELYGRYLSIYLNILSRVPKVDRVYIFDLLCGEGVYENEVEGSPCIALNSIRVHYFSHNQTCPRVTIWFNDNGLSQIDEGIYKVERVERLCEERFIPPGVNIEYYREHFDVIYSEALKKVQSIWNTKGLFFIDPYGYKDVRPQHIRKILEGGNTEVLLFLPIAQMYRFAEKSTKTSFSGGEPLRGFLIELFQSTDVRFNSVHDFVNQIKDRFRNYLSSQRIFVDTFTLERDKQNVYCLFFFTSHIKGFEKMLETKWKMDTVQGRGFILEKTLPLFDGIDGSDYPRNLMEFVKDSQYRTNEDLYLFGLLNGYLPKHTNQVLKKWKKELPNFEVFPLDNDDNFIKGFYINSKPKRRVGFRFNS